MHGEPISKTRRLERNRWLTGDVALSDELISVTQAAALMGISRATVHYLIERGDLTARRLAPSARQKGHKLYLSRAQVMAVKDTWRRRPRGGEG